LKIAYIPLFLGACFQVAVIEFMFRRVSASTVEGRPFTRFIDQDGKFMCAMGVGFAALDFMGKFTRALFVGEAVRCSFGSSVCEVDIRWETFLEERHSIFLPLVRTFGFGGFALLSWMIGPVLIQGGTMLLHAKEFTNKLQCTKQSLSTESMGMAEVFDDFGAIANWSMLKPIGKLFSCAAVPLELADSNDAFRIWDKIKTEAINAFANLLPDNLFQSWLMALHLMLLYPHWVGMFPPFALLNKIFSIFSSLASVLLGVVALVDHDRRLTMLVALILFTFMSIVVGMVGAAVVCGGMC
jgi:hypothetical protein